MGENNNKQNKLDNLFVEWQEWWESNEYKDKTKYCFNEDNKGREEWFFPDGFLGNNNECEILFISKESHEEEKPQNKDNTDFWMRRMVSGKYREGDRDGKQIRYPRYMAAIYNSLVLKLGKIDCVKNRIEDKNNSFPMLFECGYMNLNKHGGGKSTGDHFKELVEADEKNIKNQIEIMQPNIIVLMGIKKEDFTFENDVFGEYKVYEVDHPERANVEGNIDKLNKL